MRLRELDAKVVPGAAGRLRRTLDGARWPGLLDPSESSRLRRLDERFLSLGPLSLLRGFPQLGYLLIGAVFLSGTAVIFVRGGPDGRPGSAQGQAAAGGLPLALGPVVDSSIDDHFAAARERAIAATSDEPDGRFLALLSLSRPVAPAEAEQLATQNGLIVRRVYLRAPVTAGLTEVVPVDVPGDLLPGLTAVFEQTAARKVEEQREFASLASSIEPTSTADAEFRAAYEADAQAAGEEAAAYRTPCACLFALVVGGEAAGLIELAALPPVRGVELARRGAELTALDILPLFPELTGVVPAPAPAPRGS